MAYQISKHAKRARIFLRRLLGKPIKVTDSRVQDLARCFNEVERAAVRQCDELLDRYQHSDVHVVRFHLRNIYHQHLPEKLG